MGDYIHGYSEAEQRRLALMQTILNDAELARLDLTGVERILDVGAGLCHMAAALADASGGSVVAIERDPRQRAAAIAHPRVEIRPGDAMALGLDAEFDLAHCRFLLEHVPDPLAVMRGMVAAVKPGGRLVLVDDDHDVMRLWPPVPEFEAAWEGYWRQYVPMGLDPLIGRRLAGLLVDAGAVPTRTEVVFYGAVHGGPLFDPVVDNLIAVVEGAGHPEGTEALQRWREHPAATLWYSLPLVEGRRH